ncbi:DNA-directed RNA polymerase I and III subunit RPAC2 [Tremella mesenterica]|uniref:DNA-directed RNA polymerase I and III subunit RPAC2 n=1 Tax=Tremella mesenterica TaxID=5217 RepID=A0A4Q1BP58_TREME|nr:DNA-directed RNA polymerase I and III subunit RPAC2 [Tremella mesenterica]
MAETSQVNITSGLDRAGTLQQSVSAGVIHDKITILPGHEPDYSACTFCLWNEDHTLGNALRPDVEFCGYSAPHPSDPKIHLRVQMYDNLSAVECLRKALKNLRELFQSIDSAYSKSLQQGKYIQEDDVDVRAVVAETLEERARAMDIS